MFAAHELQGTDWLTAARKAHTEVNSRGSKSRGQSHFFLLYGFHPKVRSRKLPHPIPVYSDPAQSHYSAAEKLKSATYNQIKYINKRRRPAKYYEKGDELIHSTKKLRADKVKLSKQSPKWTGSFNVLKYNLQNHNVSHDFPHFPELSNISNKFHTSLRKPFTPNDDIHFPEIIQNRPGAVEEDRSQVENVLEFRSEPKTGKPQYKVQCKE